MTKIYLINISGQDKPGLTSSLTSILSSYDVRILDIGQAVIHDTLALGMLIELPSGTEISPLKKDLLLRAHDLDLTIRFQLITHGAFSEWVSKQGKDRFIITLLGRMITAEQLSRVAGIIALHGLNIDRIERLSGRKSLSQSSPDTRACVQLSVSGAAASPDKMRADLMELTHELPIDIAFQRESIHTRSRRLVAFDMDSTLIQGEVIDELAKLAGVGEQVAAITAAAMRGELDFKQSFAKRVSLLKGLPETKVNELVNRIQLTGGAERLITTLKNLGYKTAILSGGFNFVGRYLQERLGLDYLHANELDIAGGTVTGNVIEPIVDGARKAACLQEIAAKEGISLDQCIAVGDGANDLPMLNIAGLGIAFHAKPVVRQTAKHAISNLGLDGILYLVGVRDRETEK
ncbi:MAG TPA: phosphoserine phosphatase SerB [Terriglobales bacterium]|nr:phosphoserine phosphatase SerB [Terriglobales bacterium]